ncbi:cysteate racemase [Glutamicibacter uratoxydans]|uniref:aspartate/glutamate racemase family protein n=1 Tax=Glutamicibacter uratoxydans TaxID=43667 RepID=UPI001141186C|nr:amino acid racemase [Glutamicibacter uratoxydans]
MISDRPILGILGGMGPAATADFSARLAQNAHAHTDQEHIVSFCYSDPSIPDRTSALISTGRSPLPALQRGAIFLESIGASYIAIPCNTAHFWFDEIQKSVKIPIINMIDAVVHQVELDSPSLTRIGLLGTMGTTSAGIYSRGFGPSREVIDLNTHHSGNPAVAGINAVKQGNVSLGQRLLSEAAEQLIELGAQGLVFGCTEVSAAFGSTNLPFEIPVWDSSEVLANESISRMREKERDLANVIRK